MTPDTEARPERTGEPVLPRLPGESPCHFVHGLDYWTNCSTHGWSGPREQRSRVLVCPDASSDPAMMRAYRETIGRLEAELAALTPSQPVPSGLDEALDAAVDAVLAYGAAPPEYPGLALVPQPDIERLRRIRRALRVSAHSPHDQAGEPVEGFPVCSVCGAIQTARLSTAPADNTGGPVASHPPVQPDRPDIRTIDMLQASREAGVEVWIFTGPKVPSALVDSAA